MKVNPDVVVRKSSDLTAILFNPDTGAMFNMNPTAAFIWEQLEKGLDHAAILAELARVTDPGPEAAADLDDFITDLQARGYLSK